MFYGWLNSYENKKCYMWVYCTGSDGLNSRLAGTQNIVLYDYKNSRGGACAAEFLGGFSNYLQSDGYKGYNAVEEVTHVGCFAHARRKFMDAKKIQPKGTLGLSDEALSHIQGLYEIERVIKNKPADVKFDIRQRDSKPLLERIQQWLTEKRPMVIASSVLGKAIQYSLNQWNKLVSYIDDGHLSIDNNRAERAVKPFVVGRKNWLFSNSASGAEGSAMFYSIIETAKANGLNCYDYLKSCLQEFAKPNPDIELILPWNFSP